MSKSGTELIAGTTKPPGKKLAKLSQPNTRVMEAYESLSPSLMKVYKTWCELDAKTVDCVLDNIRAKGQLVSEIRSHHDKYEVGAVKRLAEALNMSANSVYTLQRFAESYSDSEFKSLKATKTPTGQRLSWSHVVALMGVSDKDVRLKLQKEAAAKSWTAKQLDDVISELYGNQRPNAGRTLSKPKTVSDGVDNVLGFIESLEKRSTEVWIPVLSAFSAKDLPESGEDQQRLRTKLLELVEAEERAIESCMQQKDLAASALETVEQSLEKLGLLQ